MFRRYGFFAALAAGLFLLASAGAADKDKDKDKGDKDDEKDPFAALIGKTAPNFTGDFALNGKKTSIAALKGKVVLLDFWAVWCGPCRAAFPDLRAWNEKYQDQGLEVIGVTDYEERFGFDKDKGELSELDADKKLSREDEQSMLKDFASHFKLDYRIMTVSKDDQKKVFEDYMVEGIPEMVLIDRKGKVRMVKLGYKEEHAKEIQKEIEELLKEKA